MAELRYLKKVYPTVSAIDVVSALLATKETTVCEDGLFVPLTLQGNRRLKLPTALFGGNTIRLCERLMIAWDIKLGISWTHCHADKSDAHAMLSRHMQMRASPPAVLEPLFMVIAHCARAFAALGLTRPQVNEGTLRHLITTLVLRVRMACSNTTIQRAFEAAMAAPWKMCIAEAKVMSKLCTELAIPTVPSTKAECTFIIESKGFVKCSPRDWTLLRCHRRPGRAIRPRTANRAPV